jgi:hypothetical protein
VPHTVEISEDGVVVGWELHLPWELNPLPANGGRGQVNAHARQVREVRDLSRLLTRDVIPEQQRIRTHLVWEVVLERKRDASNLAPLEKALVDGLRDLTIGRRKRGAGIDRTGPAIKQLGIIPDDDPRYLEPTVPEIHYTEDAPFAAHFRLEITPIPPLEKPAS